MDVGDCKWDSETQTLFSPGVISPGLASLTSTTPDSSEPVTSNTSPFKASRLTRFSPSSSISPLELQRHDSKGDFDGSNPQIQSQGEYILSAGRYAATHIPSVNSTGQESDLMARNPEEYCRTLPGQRISS